MIIFYTFIELCINLTYTNFMTEHYYRLTIICKNIIIKGLPSHTLKKAHYLENSLMSKAVNIFC